MAKIVAVCKSKKKGTRKEVFAGGLLNEEYGLVGDAHADGPPHHEISLLAVESISRARRLGLDAGPRDFAENLSTEGIDLVSLTQGTLIYIGEGVVLELIQLGKECHTRCAIYRQVGKYIMPDAGMFARAVRGGAVKTGDPRSVLEERNL